MTPKDFHRKLLDLIEDANKSGIPVLTITGVMECVKTDVIYRSIRAAEVAAVMASTGDVAGRIIKEKGNGH